ncbi:fructosamine kinase family protein [Olivibacter domesticus]|uniref:Fructosamine-3-kinase n=1 Tax=Olivibacter domesticus TaxID=407022 RepID=A0A1H7I5D3_OLID1|nr:fructosamine kinase family protein [Olivibacter domesticus]SEK57729.1 Fructosamine-3-kinase [Olivibacter domesticus]
MFLSADFVNNVELSVNQLIGTDFHLENILPVAGGDINHCYQVQGKNQSFFLKVNNAKSFPNLFILEREGLKMIKKIGGAVVPELLVAGQYKDDIFLLMTWINRGEDSQTAQEKLGRMLALLHKNTHDFFGLDYNNYLGSLPQSNTGHRKWSDFFIEERLQNQLIRSKTNGIASTDLLNKFDKLFAKIPQLFPNEFPALLHGDLWNGNYMIDNKGTPYLIDPAVYYGHREMDIALTKLFGGFSQRFYDAYQEVFPLEKDWQKRVDLCNLYVLLFHANVFGGSYIHQVEQIVEKYITK